MLREISFKENPGEPLKPFEQLMACLPPSSAELLPKPYQWLMKSKKSPIIDFYPESFTIDMNGKRWPWEAVVLLSFIDSERLISSSRNMVQNNLLTDDEIRRNQLGDAMVYVRDESTSINIPALNDRPNFGAIEGCNVIEKKYNKTSWKDDHLAANAVLRPELLPGTDLPHPGFPTLKDAPVHGLSRRKLGINVFGMRSRYRSAVLQLDREIPMITSAEAIAGKFIGTTLYFRYPFLQEGFVTAVSDADVTVRGKEPSRSWSPRETQTWKLKNDTIKRQYETGEGLTGSGGWNVPDSEVTLSIRPLKEIETLADGTKVKVYARLEVEVPIVAAIWSPSKPDPRFANVPAKLEKNPYRFGSQPSSSSVKNVRTSMRKSRSKVSLKNGKLPPTSKILPDFSSTKLSENSILPKKSILPSSSSLKNGILGSSNFSTISRPSLDALHKRRVHTPSNSSAKIISRQLSQRRAPSRVFAVATIAAAFLAKGASGATFLSDRTLTAHGRHQVLSGCRGGAIGWQNGLFESEDENDESSAGAAPPLEFAHGTTTLSFIFDGGIVAAVDSRASIGNFVGSKTTQKVLPINNHMLGTMAGGAADCSFWIRKLQAESRHYELAEGKPITVARVSRLLADYLYANRQLDLSVGTMIMGYDESGPSIYYVDNKGTRIKGDLFSVGSGSTFALGLLDTEMRGHIKEEEAIALGIKAIRHATFRDAFSGGYIAVYVITEDGWKKVFSEDLALSSENVGGKLTE
jgi:20S proteasome subunit beta 5